jgi:hypothetical protein
VCYSHPAVTRVAITLGLLCGLAVLDLQARERPAVSVLLTTGASVTPAARMALMREATGIWARAGIRLKWVSATTRPEGLSLRVVTIEQTGPATSDDAALLGELVRGAGTAAVAMIALDKASAIATRGNRHPGSLGADERLGLVLGRVIAHEIGHFLLTTSPHQTDGLMRARFPENELIDAWSTGFEVNESMRAVAFAMAASGFPARVPATSIPTATAGR